MDEPRLHQRTAGTIRNVRRTLEDVAGDAADGAASRKEFLAKNDYFETAGR